MLSIRPGLSRRLASLGDPEQLTAVLGEVASRSGPGELAVVLSAALEDLRQGRGPLASRILMAATLLFAGEPGPALRSSVHAAALDLDQGDLCMFLEAPPPLVLADVKKAMILQGKEGRPLTLGERKSLARNPGRGLVDRLVSDGSPEVVRNLLKSPKLTELDVVRIAARRPQNPAILKEIATSRRWMARYRVRVSLVSNPYLEPEMGIRLAALLFEQDRRAVAADPSIHPRLREFCDRSLRSSTSPPGEEIIDEDSISTLAPLPPSPSRERGD